MSSQNKTAKMEAIDALIDEHRYVDAIALLTQLNADEPGSANALQLLKCRNLYASALQAGSTSKPWPEHKVRPALTVPDIANEQLNRETLADGVLNHGYLLVRGLFGNADCSALRQHIDQAFDGFDAWEQDPGFANEAFTPCEFYPNANKARDFGRQNQGIFAVDSPGSINHFLHLLEDRDIASIVADYLEEPPVISANKCTLRRIKATDIDVTFWHQDGAFMGEGIRTLNLWVALSDCGVNAPGLDIIPQRLNSLVTTGEDGVINWAVADSTVARDLADITPLRPEFRAGAAIFFDHTSLHRTALDKSMTEQRYAIECWFLAPSTYPKKSPAIAVTTKPSA